MMTEPPKYDVFISYRHRDSALAEQIYRGLREREYSTFLDREKIALGESVRVAIERALFASNTFVPIFNRDVDKNANLFFELGLFMGLKRAEHRIIPIVTEQFAMDQLPPNIADFQVIRWDTSNPEAAINGLCNALGPPVAGESAHTPVTESDEPRVSIELTLSDFSASIEEQEKILKKISELLETNDIRVQSRREG